MQKPFCLKLNNFPVKMPNTTEREQIWKVTLPEQCPVSEDVDFSELARRYEMSGGGVSEERIASSGDSGGIA